MGQILDVDHVVVVVVLLLSTIYVKHTTALCVLLQDNERLSYVHKRLSARSALET